MIGRAHTGGAYRRDCIAKCGMEMMNPFIGVYAAHQGLHYRGGVDTKDCGILLLGKSRLIGQ